MWEVDDTAADQYVAAHRSPGAQPSLAGVSDAPSAGAAAAGPVAQVGAPTSGRQEAAVPAEPAPGRSDAATLEPAPFEPRPSGLAWAMPRPQDASANELVRENARLRAALAALTRAHLALVELVEVQSGGTAGHS